MIFNRGVNEFNRGVNELNRGVNELNRGVNRSVARQGCNLLRAAVTSAVTSQGCCCGNLQIHPLDLGHVPFIYHFFEILPCSRKKWKKSAVRTHLRPHPLNGKVLLHNTRIITCLAMSLSLPHQVKLIQL